MRDKYAIVTHLGYSTPHHVLSEPQGLRMVCYVCGHHSYCCMVVTWP